MKNNILLIISLFAINFITSQDLKLPSIISDNMILQQDSDVSFWGWSKSNSQVLINVSWNKKTFKVKSDSKGKWLLKVKTPKSGKSHQVSFQSNSKRVVISNILMGEVWVASGQSNMQMNLDGYRNEPVFGANDAIYGTGRYGTATYGSTSPTINAPSSLATGTVASVGVGASENLASVSATVTLGFVRTIPFILQSVSATGAVGTVFLVTSAGVTGVSAEARTVFRLDSLSSAGVINFTLSGTGGSSVTVSANIADTSDLQALATAINQQSSTTGIVARGEGAAITLINEAGDDVTITDFSGGGSVNLTGRNYDDTAADGGPITLINGGFDSTRVVGQVRLESSETFNLAGVDFSLSVDTTSNLASVNH